MPIPLTFVPFSLCDILVPLGRTEINSTNGEAKREASRLTGFGDFLKPQWNNRTKESETSECPSKFKPRLVSMALC